MSGSQHRQRGSTAFTAAKSEYTSISALIVGMWPRTAAKINGVFLSCSAPAYQVSVQWWIFSRHSQALRDKFIESLI